MASTRDRVDAYTHETRRQITALLRGEDGVPVDPRRRLNRTMVGSAILGVLVLAVVGVLGFLKGGGKADLPDSGTVLVEGSGDRYVVIDSTLHPALNMASAKLVGGAKVTTVKASALADAPRGLPVGIVGAPDALPTPSSLVGGAWTTCVVPAQASAARPAVTVMVGAGGGPALPDGRALLVTTDGRDLWLLQGGWRYQLPQASLPAVQVDASHPMLVPAAVLNTVPAAPALAAAAVPGSGHAPSVRQPFGGRIGDLVDVPIPGTGGHTYYVVLDDGVARISPLAYALLALHAPGRAITLPAGAPIGRTSTHPAPVSAAWPTQVPTLVTPARDQPICVSYDPARPAGDAPWAVTLSAPAQVPLPAGHHPVAATSGELPTAATDIMVPAGRGALVRASSSGGADGVLTLVTDAGLRFPVSSTDALSRLGYDAGSAVRVPQPFTSLLPAGPVLDTTAAAKEYSGGAVPPDGAHAGK